MQLRYLLSVLTLGLAPSIAIGQEAPPLSTELFERPWWIVEFEGLNDNDTQAAPPTFIVTDLKSGDVIGDSLCSKSWSGKIHLDLPKVSFSTLSTLDEKSCPSYKNTMALLKALEQVTYATTSPDGIEFRANNDRRVMMLVTAE